MVVEVAVGLAVVAVVGFATSLHIFYEKHLQGDDMTCSITSGCNTVVNSKYGDFYGVPIEVFGMLYYGTVIAGSGTIVYGPGSVAGIAVMDFLLAIGAAAAVVSAVLTYIQWRILEDWCQYCLLSAGMSGLIFLVELLPYTGLQL